MTMLTKIALKANLTLDETVALPTVIAVIAKSMDMPTERIEHYVLINPPLRKYAKELCQAALAE